MAKDRDGQKPQQRDGFRAAQAATEFSAALRAHQAGRMQEAEQHYRQVLAADAKHIDALHLFGVLAHQVGRSDAAVELIGKALALDERVPDFHYNIGLAYGALMNLWLWPFTTGLDSGISYVAGDPLTENLGRFVAFTLVTSMGFDIPRALTTAALVALAARPVLLALRRAARRAQFGAVATFDDPGGTPVAAASGTMSG